jgi:hypothetical protein
MGMLVKAAQTIEGLLGQAKARAKASGKSGDDVTDQVKAVVKEAGGQVKGVAAHIKDARKGR